jgi:hypothetical protein
MSSIRSKDNGANAMIRRAVQLAAGTEVAVGVFSQELADGGKGQTVADVATFNEFGLGVPERSFIRGWFDENEPKLGAFLKKLDQRVLAGELTLEQAKNQFGLICVGGIQRRMVAGIAPENAESTKKAKGSSTPLVDTGQLKSSVTYEVRR